MKAFQVFSHDDDEFFQYLDFSNFLGILFCLKWLAGEGKRGASAYLIDYYSGRKRERERPLRGRHLIPISAAWAIKSSSEMNSAGKKGRNKMYYYLESCKL